MVTFLAYMLLNNHMLNMLDLNNHPLNTVPYIAYAIIWKRLSSYNVYSLPLYTFTWILYNMEEAFPFSELPFSRPNISFISFLVRSYSRNQIEAQIRNIPSPSALNISLYIHITNAYNLLETVSHLYHPKISCFIRTKELFIGSGMIRGGCINNLFFRNFWRGTLLWLANNQ